ncbi:hypothetical protein B0T17DRAFT_460437, partial [Bombardia bombarda]
PKPLKVASEARRYYIPQITDGDYKGKWQPYSYIYYQPLVQLSLLERPRSPSPPQFFVSTGDPVDYALNCAAQHQCPVPFICVANDKRPGGDWETAAMGYEESLCRRSTLSLNLITPGRSTAVAQHYPIPICGAILSNDVVVFRGPHDKYETLHPSSWRALPVVSMPPMRWPRLTPDGTKYSFANEREMVKDKLRAALRICVYADFANVVIGDFGLGNLSRNPPQELAELWREVLLYDPDLRGRLRSVSFVFEDERQCTHQLILDEIAKKSKSSSSSSSVNLPPPTPSIHPTDYQIFSGVFDINEVHRVLSQPDSRYGLNN